MPTLLEKPADTLSAHHGPTRVLHSRHRWERWRGVLLASVIGLAATLTAVLIFHWKEPALDYWKFTAALWLGGVLLTALAAAGAWCFAPASVVHTARAMDRRLSAMNRLEAVVDLQHSSSPLARAQRDETSAYLGGDGRARPVRLLPWIIGALLVVIVSHLVTLLCWFLPLLSHPVAPVPPPAPKGPPHATITWKSPEPQIKANPIEEVPTVAIAESTSGLRNITLEISVNGLPRKSTPLPEHPFDKAGKNIIKSSL
jgi:hypothetical protein